MKDERKLGGKNHQLPPEFIEQQKEGVHGLAAFILILIIIFLSIVLILSIFG